MTRAPAEAVATPSDLERFFQYMRDFEIAYMTGDWSVLEPHFHEDARHLIENGSGALGSGGDGRDAVIAGLRGGVEAVDRRFDARIPEIVEGPVTRADGVWMRFALTLRRAGLPDLRVDGEHVTEYRDGRIAVLAETVGPDAAAQVATYLAGHDAQLKPPSSPFAPPASPHDLEALEVAMGRSMVRCYGAAKSEQDVGAALAVCDPGFSIDTVAFGIASSDRDETALHLESFFRSFPDYRVTLDGFATAPGVVTCWGRANLSFRGDFLGHAATGRRADLPVFCVFETSGGTLASERFLFDLAALCEQIGVPVTEFSAGLRALREQGLAA